MSIQFPCPACRQPIEVDDVYARQAVACPYCRQVVTAPAASSLGATPVTARPASRPADGVGPLAPGASPAPPLPGSPLPNRLGLVGLLLAGLGLGLIVFGMAQGLIVFAEAWQIPVNDTAALAARMEALRRDVIAGKEVSLPSSTALSLAGLGACVGGLLYLAGLVCSVIALFRPNRRRGAALAGTMIGLLLPLQMVLSVLRA